MLLAQTTNAKIVCAGAEVQHKQKEITDREKFTVRSFTCSHLDKCAACIQLPRELNTPRPLARLPQESSASKKLLPRMHRYSPERRE